MNYISKTVCIGLVLLLADTSNAARGCTEALKKRSNGIIVNLTPSQLTVKAKEAFMQPPTRSERTLVLENLNTQQKLNLVAGLLDDPSSVFQIKSEGVVSANPSQLTIGIKETFVKLQTKSGRTLMLKNLNTQQKLDLMVSLLDDPSSVFEVTSEELEDALDLILLSLRYPK